MKKIAILGVIVIIVLTLFGCFNRKTLVANSQNSVKYWTVGTGGNFATLEDALASPEVVSGSNILVYNGTYTVNSTIAITKSVNIFGQSQSGTIFETAGTSSDPVAMFNIQTNNVQLSKLSILDRKTTNTSVETAIVASNPSNTGSLISGVNINNCTIQMVEFGVFMRAGNWSISNNTFVYNSPLSNTKFYPMGIYAASGKCAISGNTLINQISDTTPRFIELTGTSAYQSTENFSGTLTIENNIAQSGPYFQFFIQNNWAGTPGGFNLVFEGNSVVGAQSVPSNNFIIFYPGSANNGNLLGSVTLKNNTLVNNTDANTGGKGIIGIDSASGTPMAFRSSPLTVYTSGNTVTNTTLFYSGFEQANGSSNATVGYNPLTITPVTINQMNN